MTGSGICSQVGFNDEVTAGTAVTVDHFVKHNSVTGTGLDLITVEDEGLGGCALVPTVDRTAVVGQQVAYDVEHNPGSRGFGLILKQMLGSSGAATQIAATAAYRQIHWNGDVAGKSLTFQFGFPETTAAGDVRAFTVNGCKITQWELSCARNELAKLRYTLDGWNQVTNIALAAASYPTGTGATGNEPFRFNNLSVKVGGTASVNSGLVSVADGVEVAGLRGISCKGVLPLRTDGFFSGGGGSKQEQLLAGDGRQDFTADLDIEYRSRAQVYDVLAAYTTFPLEVTFTGLVQIDAAPHYGKLSIIYPQAKFKTGNPNVTGPAGLDNKATIKAYGDPAGTLPAVQIEYISADTAL